MNGKALSILYDLEEEISEDPTPFMTYVRLECLSCLYDLEQAPAEETSKEIEAQAPLLGVFESLEMVATDSKGQTHKIGAMSKGVIREQKLKKIKKNPTLVRLCNINNSKVYYNIPGDEFWLEIYQPIWFNNKRTLKKVSSTKLERHDIETLEAFCMAYKRGFRNPLPKQMWVGKRLRRKTEKICKAFNEGDCKEKILEKLSRKNHCFG